MHRSICNLNISPGATHRAFEFLNFWQSSSHGPVPKSCSNAPHVRLNKGTLYSKVSLCFYGPFLASHFIPNAISRLLNCLTFLVTCCVLPSRGRWGIDHCQIPHLPQLGVKFHNPAGVPKSNSLLPGKGGCQMPMASPGMWGEGMLRLQIDQLVHYPGLCTPGVHYQSKSINRNQVMLIPVSLIDFDLY